MPKYGWRISYSLIAISIASFLYYNICVPQQGNTDEMPPLIEHPHIKNRDIPDDYAFKSAPIGSAALKKCVDEYNMACLKSKLVVTKVTQCTMEILETLLHEDPYIKVIHLVRDPRGCLVSQNRWGKFEWQFIESKSHALCSKMDKDLTISENLTRKHPNRILTVRYEDIAEYPVEATEYMYNFVGLNMTIDIRNYIINITNTEKPKMCIMCIIRKNATETALKWRFRIKYNDVKTIREQCSDVFNKLAYRNIVHSSQYKDQNFIPKHEDFRRKLSIMKPSELKAMAIKKATKI